MGNFRSNTRGGFRDKSSGRFGGGAGGNRGGFGRGRNFDRERRPLEMYDAVCSKCGEKCKVPFKPTGSKPVFCSDCFKQNNGPSSNFDSRNKNAPSQSRVSVEQFKQINAKLDKILLILENLEIEIEEDSDLDEDDELEIEDDDLDEDEDDDLDEDDDGAEEEDVTSEKSSWSDA